MISKPCFARHFAQVMVNYHNGVLGGQPPDIDELKSECMYVSTSTMRKKVHLLRHSSIWAYSLWTTCAVNFWHEGSGNTGPILRSNNIVPWYPSTENWQYLKWSSHCKLPSSLFSTIISKLSIYSAMWHGNLASLIWAMFIKQNREHLLSHFGQSANLTSRLISIKSILVWCITCWAVARCKNM